MGFIDDFKAWLKELVKKLFDAVWDFLKDVLISILELFLDAITALIDLIPVPDFITDGMQSLVNSFPPLTLYVIDQTGINAALGILSAGLLVRLIRKFVTLFQW